MSCTARQYVLDTRGLQFVFLPRRNGSEMHSTIRNGLIPRRNKSTPKKTDNLCFHCSELDGRRSKREELRCDLDMPRSAPSNNTWRPQQNTVYWCNLKLVRKRGLQLYQTRSHAIVLYNTLHPICIEKAVCTKTKQELYHKVINLQGCLELY